MQRFASRVVQAVKFYPNLHPGAVEPIDSGNVFQRVTTMDLSEVRTAVGFGVRYKSPVGPIRFDLGFKLNRRPDEQLTAWFVTFGQAF